MRRRTGIAIALAATLMVAVSCGDDAAPTTTAAPATTTTAAATTAAGSSTTAATTTTTTTTEPTTTLAAGRFTADDLFAAVLHDGDPWPVPVVGAEPFEITIDDIWPSAEFPSERAAYEAAGFQAASFSYFASDDGGILLTGAHLFADAPGAEAAFDIIETSFNDFELVARITNLPPGALNMALPLRGLDFGDRAAGVMLSGPDSQVVGVIWITGNLLQFVRAGMNVGDEDRTVAALGVAQAMADRMG